MSTSRKNSTPTKKAAKPSRATTPATRGVLSPITKNYIECVCSLAGRVGSETLPRIPDGSMPSATFLTSVRGTAYTNTTGFGYIMVDPLTCSCNDVTGVYVSLAAGTTEITSAVSSQADNLYAVSDFTTTTLAPGWFRPVSGCIEICYDGKLLDTSGHYLGASVPSGDFRNFSEENMLKDQSVRRVPIEAGKPYCVMLVPQLTSDNASVALGVMNAWTDADYISTFGSLVPMCLMMRTQDPGVPFTFRVLMTYEWSPNVELASPVLNHLSGRMESPMADPTGLPAAQSVLSELRTGFAKESMGYLKRGAISAASKVLEMSLSGLGYNVPVPQLTSLAGLVARQLSYDVMPELQTGAVRTLAAQRRTELLRLQNEERENSSPSKSSADAEDNKTQGGSRPWAYTRR
jgi:hypothetical protein